MLSYTGVQSSLLDLVTGNASSQSSAPEALRSMFDRAQKFGVSGNLNMLVTCYDVALDLSSALSSEVSKHDFLGREVGSSSTQCIYYLVVRCRGFFIART